jgi:hypothetical protein
LITTDKSKKVQKLDFYDKDIFEIGFSANFNTTIYSQFLFFTFGIAYWIVSISGIDN